jgi:hypothetical protein
MNNLGRNDNNSIVSANAATMNALWLTQGSVQSKASAALIVLGFSPVTLKQAAANDDASTPSDYS